MSKSTLSFITGTLFGIILSSFLSPEERKKLQKKFTKHANDLYKTYDGPIKEKTAQVKEFVKERLS